MLDELSSILSVIRQSDEATSTTDPLPTLDDLNASSPTSPRSASRSNGTPPAHADRCRRRRPRRLPDHPGIPDQRPSPRRAASRHPATHLRPRLRCASRSLNDIDAGTALPERTGHGIVGMRERVAAAGGTIEIGPTAGGQFRVHATPATERGRTMTIRVLLADDQALIRAGFRALIDSAARPRRSSARPPTGAEAVTLARTSRADVVLMDIRMPDMDGIAATRAITTDDDMAGVRVLILTTFEIDDHVFRGAPGRRQRVPRQRRRARRTPRRDPHRRLR